MTDLGALARYARRKARGGAPACEICATPLGASHPHVVDTRAGALQCACAACALVLSGNARFRRVPARPRREPRLALSRAELESLGVPVGLAFFLRATHLGGRWVLRLPSPAGVLEAELEEDAWSRLASRNELSTSIAPDVEALLVYARRSGAVECLVAPIDACYELAGLLRRHYRGFTGGDEAHGAIETYFSELCAKAQIASEEGR